MFLLDFKSFSGNTGRILAALKLWGVNKDTNSYYETTPYWNLGSFIVQLCSWRARRREPRGRRDSPKKTAPGAPEDNTMNRQCTLSYCQ